MSDSLLVVWLEELAGVDGAAVVDVAVVELHPPGVVAGLEHGGVPFLSEVGGILIRFMDCLLNLKYASAANIIEGTTVIVLKNTVELLLVQFLRLLILGVA